MREIAEFSFHGCMPVALVANLKILLCPNSRVDPFHQYAAAEAAYGHGIIGRAQMTALAEKERQCQDLLNQKQYASSVCFDLLDNIVSQSYGTTSSFKVSQYDIRKVESRRGARTFPPGHKTVETYLGGKRSAAGMSSSTMTAALEALHATPSRTAGQVYMECTNPPVKNFLLLFLVMLVRPRNSLLVFTSVSSV